MIVTPGVRALLSIKGNPARRAVIGLLKHGIPLPAAFALGIIVPVMLAEQERLGADFERVWDENVDKLYES